jgi:hypothetical protein
MKSPANSSCNASAVVSNREPLTYEDIYRANRTIQYPSYDDILIASKAVQNKIERVFRLKKFIDNPSTLELHKEAAIAVLEDIRDGYVK